MRTARKVLAGAAFAMMLVAGWGWCPNAAAQPALPGKLDPRKAGDVAQAIDGEVLRALQAKQLPASALADDAEFLRRAFIDITGRIPTRERAAAFLDSTGPDKRRKLIDELLDSPHFGESFANEWRDLIDNPEVDGLHRKYVAPFRNWLAQGFNENRAWDLIVTDMLTAQGEADKNPAAFFLLANMMMGQPDAGQLTASATRLFLGIDLACAQCHDHLQEDAWKHQDFWRLAAFFGHVRDDGKVGDAGMVAKAPVIIEADGPSKRQEQRWPAVLCSAEGGGTSPIPRTRKSCWKRSKLAPQRSWRPFSRPWASATPRNTGSTAGSLSPLSRAGPSR